MSKVFRIYDDDDNGSISAANLKRCAKDLMEDVTDEEVNQMIKMGDKKGNGEVDHEDYLNLMRHVGLIPNNPEKDETVADPSKAADFAKMEENLP